MSGTFDREDFLVCPMGELWARQPGETSRAFKCFAVYRDLGPQRTMAAAAEVLGRKPGGLHTLAHKYHWSRRAAAWDDEQERIARIRTQEKIQEMYDRHTGFGMLMQEKAYKKLKPLEPDELTPKQAMQFLIEGTNLERKSRGLPTEIQEQRLSGEVNIGGDEIAQRILADPDIAERIAEHYRAKHRGEAGS